MPFLHKRDDPLTKCHRMWLTHLKPPYLPCRQGITNQASWESESESSQLALNRIQSALVGLKMPRALEALDHTLQQLEKGEITAIEAIDTLLSEEYATRETRRIDVALRTAKLLPVKTLEGFEFSFQPSLDRERIAALAQLGVIRGAEVVHFLGPPGTGKSHLATALGVAAVKAGRSVYRATLADLITALSQAEREGRLAGECPELCVSGPVHAVSDTQASKRSPNVMANWLRAANHSLTFLPSFSKLRMAR